MRHTTPLYIPIRPFRATSVSRIGMIIAAYAKPSTYMLRRPAGQVRHRPPPATYPPPTVSAKRVRRQGSAAVSADRNYAREQYRGRLPPQIGGVNVHDTFGSWPVTPPARERRAVAKTPDPAKAAGGVGALLGRSPRRDDPRRYPRAPAPNPRHHATRGLGRHADHAPQGARL